MPDRNKGDSGGRFFSWTLSRRSLLAVPIAGLMLVSTGQPVQASLATKVKGHDASPASSRAGSEAALTDYSLSLNPDGQSATLRWCVRDARTSGVMLVFGFQGWEGDSSNWGYKQYQDLDGSARPGESRCIVKPVTWDGTVPTGYVRVGGTTSVRVGGFGDFPVWNEYGYLGKWVTDNNIPGSEPFLIGNTCRSPNAVGPCSLPMDLGQAFWLGPLAPPSQPQQVRRVQSSSVTWFVPESLGGTSEVSYLVEVRPAGGSWALHGTLSGTTIDLSTLSAGSYDVRVAARNSVGTGSWSGAVNVTVATPTPTPTPNTGRIVTAPSGSGSLLRIAAPSQRIRSAPTGTVVVNKPYRPHFTNFVAKSKTRVTVHIQMSGKWINFGSREVTKARTLTLPDMRATGAGKFPTRLTWSGNSRYFTIVAK